MMSTGGERSHAKFAGRFTGNAVAVQRPLQECHPQPEYSVLDSQKHRELFAAAGRTYGVGEFLVVTPHRLDRRD
jgi:hypothetical protein